MRRHKCETCGRFLRRGWSWCAHCLGFGADHCRCDECAVQEAGQVNPRRVDWPNVVRWLLTELPIGWQEVAEGEGRSDVVIAACQAVQEAGQ